MDKRNVACNNKKTENPARLYDKQTKDTSSPETNENKRVHNNKFCVHTRRSVVELWNSCDCVSMCFSAVGSLCTIINVERTLEKIRSNRADVSIRSTWITIDRVHLLQKDLFDAQLNNGDQRPKSIVSKDK